MKPVKRAGTIRIRVSYQVQDRMQSISDRFGVPVSTLAALAVGKCYGATPCNIVSKLLEPNHVEGIAGVNLPMLVRALTYRNGDLGKLAEKALSGGQEGVINFTEEACKEKNK